MTVFKGAGLLKRTQPAEKDNLTLFLFLVPALIVVIVFMYIPMYGIIIAFKDYRPFLGIFGSKWVGLKHFIRFFQSYKFVLVLRNTVGISFYSIVAGFPAPILLALLINQIRRNRYKKVLQTVTYMPHFISTVVAVGMVVVFLNPSTGMYGHILRWLGVSEIKDPLAQETWFSSIYVLSDIWQHTGWDSIIYLAALASIDVNLYEAATVDGAGDLQKMRHIDIPSMLPTAIILLILRTGSIMNVGFEKIFLLQNGLNIDKSEVIATYVYKAGLQNQQYSLSTAVGLFNSIVNFVVLLAVNLSARKAGEVSLF